MSVNALYSPHRTARFHRGLLLIAGLVLGIGILLAGTTYVAHAGSPPAAPIGVCSAASQASSVSMKSKDAALAACSGDFNVIASPNPGPGYNAFNAVAVVSSNDVWAVGYYAYAAGSYSLQTLIEHWNGSTWAVVPSPSVRQGADDNYLLGVAAVSANDVWAVGFHQPDPGATEQLIMHWDGSVWRMVSQLSPPGTSGKFLYSVAAISASDVWAVGYTNQYGSPKTLTEHWDGTQWSVVTSPSPASPDEAHLIGVTAVASNNVWAVGYTARQPDVPDATLIEHWNGTQWSIIDSPNISGPNDSYLKAVSARTANDIWAVGYYRNGSHNKSLVEHWDGNTWTVVPSPNPAVTTDTVLNSVVAIAANDVWAVGRYLQPNPATWADPLVEHWDGSSWSIVSNPGEIPDHDSFLAGIAARGGDLWAVGGDRASVVQVGLAEHWDSTRWTISPVAGAGDGRDHLYGVAAISAGDVWAVGSNGGARAIAIHWDGSGWSSVPSPSSSAPINTLNAVAGSASNDVWAVGSYGLVQGTFPDSRIWGLIEHWDGAAWSIVPEARLGTGDNYLLGLAVISATDAWAVGYTDGESGDNTLVEHWNGTSWSVVPSPSVASSQNVLSGVAAISANDVWAVGHTFASPAYQPLIEHWNGTSWSIVSGPAASGTSELNSLSGVSGTASNDVWAVGNLITHWDGSQWSIVDAPMPPRGGVFHSVTAVSARDAWAVGTAVGANGNIDNDTLIEHWDGSQWSLLTSPNPAGNQSDSLEAVDAVSSEDVIAVGSYVSSVDSTLVERYTIGFSDVPPGSTFHPYVRCLSCRGLISGYPDGTFRPSNLVTRGQLSKIVSNAAGLTSDPGQQIFEDVPPGSDFYVWVQRLAARGFIAGYPCGGAGEPCVAPGNRYYFRPGANATRAQIAKIVSNAAGYANTPATQTFEDVPPSNGFYVWIERLAERGIMAGYTCGGVGEPCVAPGNRPYFRLNNNATRGQTSKIVSNTFFPNCQTASK